MTHAEFLPDNINMVTQDGDVVIRDDLVDADQPDIETAEDPFEADRSPNYFVVQEIIQSGIEQSREDGSGTITVRPGERQKPLGQFMAIDLYKYGLSADEVQDLLDRYLPQSVETEQSKKAVRKELGRHATAGAGNNRYFDVRERASGLHKEFDD